MSIGWVDFSKEDRDKVLSVINMLKEKGAVDELGVGVIRDAFSNYFFPGTSTVQTRAKYFLLVAYELYEASKGKYGTTSVNDIIRNIDATEKQCGIDMMKLCPGENSGIIGRVNLQTGRWVARKPYEIYWNGLCTYQIFKNRQISFREYISYIIIQNRKRTSNVKLGNRRDEAAEGTTDDLDALDSDFKQLITMPSRWDKNWKKQPRIELNKQEAAFLRMQIESSVPNSLLGIILKNNVDIQNIKSFDELAVGVRPVLETKGDLGKEISKLIELACEFNDLVFLSRIRYNVMLSNGNNKNANIAWNEYSQDLNYNARVRLDEIEKCLGVRDKRLMFFLRNLKEAFLNNDIATADQLIIKREEQIKDRARAKLQHRDDYPDNDWVGGGRLDFRFGPMKKIVCDIFEGEKANV